MKPLILMLIINMTGCSGLIHRTCSDLLRDKIFNEFSEESERKIISPMCMERGICIKALDQQNKFYF